MAFLTWFPAWFPGARLRRKSQRDISNSRAWFPLVGLFIGILLLLVQLVAFDLFSGFLTAAIVLFVLSAVTRGLHLDGLMDVCDGIFGGHTPERRLEIMKDPHVGAFGVVGLVLILLLKFGALASLSSNYLFDASSVPGWWSSVEVPYAPVEEVQLFLNSPGITLLLFPVLSRWSMVVSLGAFPYARTQGLGSPFHQGGIGISTAAAAVMALALAVVLGGFGGLVLFVGVTALALAMGWAMTRSLGGLTGDCYGATNEVCEVAVLVAALALARYGWLETFGRAIGLGF